MLGNLAPDAQQQALRMYMAQQGAAANPANMTRMMQQLAANPQMAQAAVNLFMNNQASMSDRAGAGPGSRLIEDFMARDGTGAPNVAQANVPLPPRRPANLAVGGGGGAVRGNRGGGAAAQTMTGMGTAARGGPDVVPGDVQLANAPLPPVRPKELGPGAAPPAEAPAGEPTDYGGILANILAASAIGAGGYGAYKMGSRQGPPPSPITALPEGQAAPPATPRAPRAAPAGAVDLRNVPINEPGAPKAMPAEVATPESIPITAFDRAFKGDVPSDYYDLGKENKVRVPAGRSEVEAKPETKAETARTNVKTKEPAPLPGGRADTGSKAAIPTGEDREPPKKPVERRQAGSSEVTKEQKFRVPMGREEALETAKANIKKFPRRGIK